MLCTYGTNERVLQLFFCFHKNIEEVKKLKEHPANVGRKTVEMIDFEETEAEKLELVKRHMGLKQNREVIKALICEKCDEIKLLEEAQRKRQIEEAKAMEWLEKGEYKCPM
jgi:hypothetical protein